MRVRTNWPAPSPRRRALSQLRELANPPTMKNIGITCSTQVAAQPNGISSIGLGIEKLPEALR